MSFKDDHPEFFWFLIIMIGVFFLWLLTGGPERSYQIRNDKFIEPLSPFEPSATYDQPFLDVDKGTKATNPVYRQSDY